EKTDRRDARTLADACFARHERDADHHPDDRCRLTCTVKETFAPTAIGPASDTLTVDDCPVARGPCIRGAIPVRASASRRSCQSRDVGAPGESSDADDRRTG